MEYIYPSSTSNDDKNYCIVSTKRLSKYENDQISIYIDGKVFFDDQLVSAEKVVEHYLSLNSSIEVLYQKLSGQFWLLLEDKKKNTVTLVNDHFAIKPCYWGVFEGVMYVSNSLKLVKNIKKIKLSISEQALFNYMYFHCIPSPNTIFEQFNKLEPGKSLTYKGDNECQSALLYQPVFAQQNSNISSASKDCLSVIDRAVEKYTTDDCGAFLSGGLDSSSVAGMLARHQQPAKTFSIGFNIKGYDETSYAKLTANHFGTEHKVHYLTPEEAAEDFVKVAQYFDEPFGNSSAMATYFCAKFAKEHGVNTLLGGDGGDELFAGNDRYAKQKQFEIYQQVPSVLSTLAKGVFCNTPIGKIPLLSKGASYINQAEIPLPERLETYNFINRFGINDMFTESFLSKVDVTQPVSQQKDRYFESSSEDPVDRMLYLDWKFTLADNDLVKVGRMCEMADVDVSFPLLDKTVVDFSCTIPAGVKLPGNKLRDFYKESCRGFLANDTLTKSKQGFGLPFGVWMKENQLLKELAYDNLLAFKKREIVKESLIDKVIEAHQSVHASYYGELIWIMVVLELWLQQD